MALRYLKFIRQSVLYIQQCSGGVQITKFKNVIS